MYFIGVDLGTSAVKLLLMDEGGAVKKTVSKEYPLFFPHPGWSEQRPEDWWEAVQAGIRELIASIDASEVAGLSFGGQMHGLVILDENDRVIRPAILWNDGRTQEETEYLNTVIGKEKLSAYTANIAFAGFTAPKLLWLKKHEPENFARIAKIMLPKDYIAYKMTGVHSTDYSDASGMLLLDVKRKCWSREMIDVCGICEEMLPRLYESYEVTGTLLPEAAESLGLPASCKVAAGAGDNAAAAVGTGTVGDGACNVSLGTSGTIFISSRTFLADPNYALHAFAHADGHYHLMGCMLSAASCNKWWMENILGTKDYAGEQEKIFGSEADAEKCGNGLEADVEKCRNGSEAPCAAAGAETASRDGSARLGENHVFFLPYLMGERSPHNDPAARGTFIGMTMDTTRADLTQAVLEGVAFGIRDSFEVAKSLGISVSRTKICGGGAKSPLWRKIMANVLNIPVDSIESEEGPGLGGAMLAAVACGVYASVEEAAEKIVRVSGTVEPEPELAAKYERQYRKFAQIYPRVKELFPVIGT